METVYYNLDARRVSTHEMASGETAPQCRSYAVLRKVEEKRGGEMGKVLDLEAYRRKQTQAAEEAWNEEERYEAVPPAPAAQIAAPRTRRARVFGLTLDALATAAIVVMATVVVTAFLPFL